MKKNLFYSVISVATAIICFTGCTESSASDSKSDKRALDEESTQKNTAAQTTVTTLTPLQTFAKITAIESTEASETIAEAQRQTTQAADNSKDNWFEQNKLFELDVMENNSSSHVQTWYRFPGNEDTTTTVSVTQTPTKEQPSASMLTRSAMDFVPGE